MANMAPLLMSREVQIRTLTISIHCSSAPRKPRSAFSQMFVRCAEFPWNITQLTPLISNLPQIMARKKERWLPYTINRTTISKKSLSLVNTPLTDFLWIQPQNTKEKPTSKTCSFWWFRMLTRKQALPKSSLVTTLDSLVSLLGLLMWMKKTKTFCTSSSKQER